MLFIKLQDPEDAQGGSSAISAEGREVISKNLQIWYFGVVAWLHLQFVRNVQASWENFFSRNTTSLNWMGQREYKMYGGHQALSFYWKKWTYKTDQLQTHAAFPKKGKTIQRVEPKAQNAVKNPESGVVLSYTQNKKQEEKVGFLFKEGIPGP